jgi:hypothetical protein
MDIVEIIAERRIEEAIRKGEFDNLEGAGKPLEPDGLDSLPDDVRVSAKILKNAGYLPEDAEIRKQIYSLKQLISLCNSELERKDLSRKLSAAELRLSMILERRKSEIPPEYREKLF